MPTAGILVIGNEILSGKVVDTNSPYLCERLRELGVDVERIVTIPDVIETIASEVKAMSETYDYVFTSGGIGPTHDDLTIEGVAAAFGRPVEIDESELEEMLRSAIGEDLNEGQLKMAKVPAGATLLDSRDKWFSAGRRRQRLHLSGHSRGAAQEVRVGVRLASVVSPMC